MSIIVVDFGSQFTQLIAKRLRESKVIVDVLLYKKVSLKVLKGYKGVIVSGSDRSVLRSADEEINAMKLILEYNERFDVPVLCICFGMHLVCRVLGFGSIKGDGHAEYGRTLIKFHCDSALTSGLEGQSVVWMSHRDGVGFYDDDSEFILVATSDNGNAAVIVHKCRRIYGVQFHPEVTHTKCGDEILQNFVSLSGCERLWNLSLQKELILDRVKAKVGTQKVLAAVSGGVDSTVAAFIVHEAIGDNLKCVMIDHGLLRKNEVQEVADIYKSVGVQLHVYDESKRFLSALEGVRDGEKKRKIIGRLFIECFERQAEDFGDIGFLMQGTLYPDVIESGSNGGCIIKSHHNVGGLPEEMGLELLEPLRELFKYEVRKLGVEIGISEDFIYRHPFPGPGLAIRIPGEVTTENLGILREADAIYTALLKKQGFYRLIWQAFIVLLPVKAVGVMGDARSDGYACVLRAVTSTDGMTADVYPLSDPDELSRFWSFLQNVSVTIVNSVPGISRVLYDITSKPPGTIEWE